MATINVYLKFSGNCHEAMSFYQECFGGKLTIETVGSSPMKSDWPHEAQNKVLHSGLESGDIAILASDMLEQGMQNSGSNVALALICKTEQEMEMYFQRLSSEGTVLYPIHSFYNGKMGSIMDKFGTHWILKL